MNLKILTIILLLIAAGTGAFVLRQAPAEHPAPTPSPGITASSSPVSSTAPSAPSTPISAKPPATKPPAAKADDTGATAAGVSEVVNSSNQFALNLYLELNKKDEGNLFFSPYSIATAMAMVYEGARGKTADEIRDTFYFPTDNGVRRASFAAIYNQLNATNAEYKLSVANALWVQKGFTLLAEYVNTLKRYYVGNATNLDFVGASETARKTINTWVEDHTNDKIKDLIPQDVLSPDTALVITNAVYFKGRWAREFDTKLTKNEDFRVDSATTVQIPMMRQTDEEARFKYIETPDVQVIELPYKGKRLSMVILLPKESIGLASLESSLSLNKLNEWKSQLREQRVNLFMPKLTFDTKYFLKDTLGKLGMPTAFIKEDADLSGITGRRDVFIQNAIHQAFVDVNEEGTEAAAATAIVGGGITSVAQPPRLFRADHPFMFLIQDSESGAILFLGKVTNPS